MKREKPRRSFIARWWLLIPLAAFAAIWWMVFFAQARKLWTMLFG